ncbi:MAG: carboxylesterase family protein [Acidobacteriota bacterium]|nr:carboxylesterase family protein [Acidobacteriota bacterium]
MDLNNRTLSGTVSLFLALTFTVAALAADQVHTNSGVVEGVSSAASKIRIFEGIPFAAPPVGNLRWQPPQPVAAWTGVRKANAFGARCMQGHLFSDMVFRDSGPSEDCLYLNVWTPADSANAHLPVMVWIYGGGFQAGASSEPRQDGENLAKKGVIVVSLNYRLGLFGFFSHPELSKESPHHASGNYGLLDQAAALEWVHKNIAAFGGDPNNVTIFGESAGSMSVSALMAAPVSRGLFNRAIGESGGIVGLKGGLPALSKTEQDGARFAESVGASSLQSLRAKSAEDLLQAATRDRTAGFRFWPNIDGYFFPESPSVIYSSGKEAHVPLLAGWNSDEGGASAIFGKTAQTKENYISKVRELYGHHADDILKAYPADSDQQAKESARDLASDRFIAYSTWKWIDLQLETGESPVYRYHFEQAPPSPEGKPSRGAYHSADIEFVFETLDSKKLPWTDADRKLSGQISSYWTNFAKSGNPNGSGLPEWPSYTKAGDYQVMHLHETPDSTPLAKPDALGARYQQFNAVFQNAQ